MITRRTLFYIGVWSWALWSVCALAAIAVGRSTGGAVIALSGRVEGRGVLVMIDAQREQAVAYHRSASAEDYGERVAWSPDGERLAYVYVRATAERYLYVGALGRPLRRLYAGIIAPESPLWSPDGRWLAIQTWPSYDLLLVNEAETRAVDSSRLAHTSAMWLDDNRLGYALYDANTEQRALYIAALGRAAERITPLSSGYRQPSWSPNGRYVLYLQDDAEQTRPYLLALAAGTTRALELAAYQQPPRWSPNGRYAVITARQGVEEAAYLLDTATLETVALAYGGRVGYYAWSPDSRLLAYSVNDGGGWRLYVTAIPPRDAQPLPLAPMRSAYRPQWSSDGRYLAYISRGAQGEALYLVQRDSWQERLIWRAPSARINAIAWRP